MTTDETPPPVDRSDDPDRRSGNGPSEDVRRVRALYEDRHPTPELEERVVADWRRRSRPNRLRFGRLVQVAALLVAFIAGRQFGQSTFDAGPATPEGNPEATVASPNQEPRYALLIYTEEGPEQPDPVAETNATEEYTRWARSVASGGREVSGERLLDESRLVASGESGPITDLVLGGYFVVQADNLDEAVELARGHPHIRRGGTIEVRPIGPS